MLTVDDRGNHGAWLGENPCVERTVGTYLSTGRLPATDTVCPGVPLPGERRVYPVGTRLRAAAPKASASERPERLEQPGRPGLPGRPGPGSNRDTPAQEAVRERARERFERAWSRSSLGIAAAAGRLGPVSRG